MANSEQKECPKCYKTYSNVSALQRHIREVHMKKRVKCHICGHKTARAHDLLFHIKRRHPLTTGPEEPAPTPKKRSGQEKRKLKSCTDTPKTRMDKLKGYRIPKHREHSPRRIKTKAMLKDMPTIVVKNDQTPPMFTVLPPRPSTPQEPLLPLPPTPPTPRRPLSPSPSPPTPPLHQPPTTGRPPSMPPSPQTTSSNVQQLPSSTVSRPPSSPESPIPSTSADTVQQGELFTSPRLLGTVTPKWDMNNNTVTETAIATETLVSLMETELTTPERIIVTDVIKEQQFNEEPIYEVLTTTEDKGQPKIPEISFQGSVSIHPESFRMTVQGSFKDTCKIQ